MNAEVANLTSLLDALRRELNVDVCTLYIANTQSEYLELAASSGLNATATGARLLYSQGLTGKVARTQTPVAARDISTHPDNFVIAGSDEEQFKSYLGIPLTAGDTLYGVLVVQTTCTKTFFLEDIRHVVGAGRALLGSLNIHSTGQRVSNTLPA